MASIVQPVVDRLRGFLPVQLQNINPQNLQNLNLQNLFPHPPEIYQLAAVVSALTAVFFAWMIPSFFTILPAILIGFAARESFTFFDNYLTFSRNPAEALANGGFAQILQGLGQNEEVNNRAACVRFHHALTKDTLLIRPLLGLALFPPQAPV